MENWGYRKREATLLMLRKRGVTSRDMQERIFRKVFPTLKTIELYLEGKGVSIKDAPETFTDGPGFDCILAQEGGWVDDEFGVPPEDMQWLRKMAHALGFKYKDLGKYKYRRLYDITIPERWCFNPARAVEAVEICGKCRKKMTKDQIAHTQQLDHYCQRCYEYLACKGYFQESELESEDGLDFAVF